MAIVTRLMLMLVMLMLVVSLAAALGPKGDIERVRGDDEASLKDRVQLHNIVRRAAGADIVENQQDELARPAAKRGGGRGGTISNSKK